MKFISIILTVAFAFNAFAAGGKPGRRGPEEGKGAAPNFAKANEVAASLGEAAFRNLGLRLPTIDFSLLNLSKGTLAIVLPKVEGLMEALKSKTELTDPAKEAKRKDIADMLELTPAALESTKALAEYAAREGEPAESQQLARDFQTLILNSFNFIKAKVNDTGDTPQNTVNAKQIKDILEIFAKLDTRSLTKEDIMSLEQQVSAVTKRWRDALACE